MISSSSTVFMVRPAGFQYNEETAVSNDFQSNVPGISQFKVLDTAKLEFDTMVSELEHKGIEVIVFEDSELPIKPDAIFPNNWISLSQDGIMTIFSMKTFNRQLEKNQKIIDFFKRNYEVDSIIDLSEFESQGLALEGTGSIVYDHVNRQAYACISPRTDKSLFESYCQQINYKPIVFHSYDSRKKLIYHTNVVMCIGDGYVIIGLESILDSREREILIEEFKRSNLEIISLDNIQLLQSFAGNMLEVRSKNGAKNLVMSKRAYNSLKISQLEAIKKYATPLPVSIDLIETIGGGSARCMMAEVYLKKK